MLREKVALKNSKAKDIRITILNDKIIDFKKRISDNDKKRLIQLQEKLVGNSNNYIFKRNKIPCLFNLISLKTI